MTSIVSRDDVEAELWRAGIRDWVQVSRIMKIVDTYALTHARDYKRPEDLPAEPWAHLAPGNWDAEARLTRCLGCSAVKSWDGNFTKDVGHITRHRIICKVCEGKAVVSDKPGKLYLCRKCEKRKELAEFPAKKRLNPSVGCFCSSCEDEVAASKTFFCRRCKRNKLIGEFPPEKKANPAHPYPCLDCDAKFGWHKSASARDCRCD